MHPFCSCLRDGDKSTRLPLQKQGVKKNNTSERLPSNRTFIDDLTLTTETHVQVRWMLSALEKNGIKAYQISKPNNKESQADG